MNIAEGVVDLTKQFEQSTSTVFAAWSNEQAQLIWTDPGTGWSMSFDTFRFEVGQMDVCRFGPDGGPQYLNENRYLAIEPARRIVYSSSLSSGGRLSFAGTVVVTFEAAGDGTRMRLVEQGLYFDGHDGVEGHQSGWESMLDGLTRYLAR
jgi:uncharacterized protein YndB with AHSA1/START domain